MKMVFTGNNEIRWQVESGGFHYPQETVAAVNGRPGLRVCHHKSNSLAAEIDKMLSCHLAAQTVVGRNRIKIRMERIDEDHRKSGLCELSCPAIFYGRREEQNAIRLPPIQRPFELTVYFVQCPGRMNNQLIITLDEPVLQTP